MANEDKEMYKRHEVMDMFNKNINEEIGEWEDINEKMPKCKGRGCKVKVKLSTLTETFAYYYVDMKEWIAKYGKKPCYFWDCHTKEPLFNVTHWKILNPKE
jgi:hypothetical protein